MEIEVPRGTLFTLVGAIFLLALALLGRAVTPYSQDGRALVLSPSLWRLRKYQTAARGWLDNLEHVEGDLDQMLQAAERADLLMAMNRLQRVRGQVEQVQIAIDRTQPPVVAAVLHEDLAAAAQTYQGAVTAVMRYLGEPTEDNQTTAQTLLDEARSKRTELEARQVLRP